ncbi:MAG: hypothetical protein AAF467_27770 [Actinomycetota bacterium]
MASSATTAGTPKTARHRLLDGIVSEQTDFADLADFVRHHRPERRSWDWIVAELRRLTGEELSRQTVINWLTPTNQEDS